MDVLYSCVVVAPVVAGMTLVGARLYVCTASNVWMRCGEMGMALDLD